MSEISNINIMSSENTPVLKIAHLEKSFGKHKIKWKIADGKKSVEGSLAMFICSVASVFTVLAIRGGIALPLCLAIAMLAAVVCTLTELCAKNGLDTVICPTFAMLVIIPTVMLFRG